MAEQRDVTARTERPLDDPARTRSTWSTDSPSGTGCAQIDQPGSTVLIAAVVRPS